MSDDLSTRGIEHQRRRMTRDLGAPETADAGALDAREAEAWSYIDKYRPTGPVAMLDWLKAKMLIRSLRRDATPALDVDLLAKALDAVKRHGGNYVDRDHLLWYADAIARNYEALRALRAAESPTPEPDA